MRQSSGALNSSAASSRTRGASLTHFSEAPEDRRTPKAAARSHRPLLRGMSKRSQHEPPHHGASRRRPHVGVSSLAGIHRRPRAARTASGGCAGAISQRCLPPEGARVARGSRLARRAFPDTGRAARPAHAPLRKERARAAARASAPAAIDRRRAARRCGHGGGTRSTPQSRRSPERGRLAIQRGRTCGAQADRGGV